MKEVDDNLTTKTNPTTLPSILTSQTNDSLDKINPEVFNGKLTKVLVISAFGSLIGGSFQFGYNIGCMNAPSQFIIKWIKKNSYSITGHVLEQKNAETIFAIIASIYFLGGMIGSLLTGFIADTFGRKKGLILNNIFIFIGTLLQCSAIYFKFYYLLYAGRFCIGISCGLATGLTPMYLCEIAPKNMLGLFGNMNQVFITFSILFSQILGLSQIFGTSTRWQFILVFPIIPMLLQLLILPFSPESPKHELIVQNNIDNAITSLRRLRNEEDIYDEIEYLKREDEITKVIEKTSLKNIFKNELRWPMLVAIVMMLSQKLSGIDAVLFYSTSIFESAGLKGSAPIYGTIGIGFVLFLQTLISTWLVEHPKFGRRPLHLFGLIGMFFASIGLVACLIIQNQNVSNMVKQIGSYGAIVTTIIYILSFASGPGGIPWFFVSEIFNSSARGISTSIACFVNWMTGFFVGLIFPIANGYLKEYTFLIFIVLLGLCILFVFKYVPETKGKNVDEIQVEMKRMRKL
ncbi:Sugar/inositol transporter family and General substrate transporter family and Major facilitator superfamily domain, general substrate transporter and Major facilitator superfamily domain-containing protein [Strongyloides ratti]|uniref:Sugar/inositol transporter family and General substrate transporter family and Major facilitator superfamily domain, general substrate transporter and Major facilitator superfamily dom... n=1 Tax=Strongyloides ratti TaxID=34506 RepID=A0A090LHQ2_STRRB|nr:Sugar/inositol transporter family and General substrate transporter family and Major facilitator superfamily domain, general substrate transporter and Major facilitator superfamily domain-containing protein [Strongyloides ratti]CEF67045.1 Sugar/inositol transporter family and General substrate transporter family and Major facilitator superfamily domain, general substrate transporter and Major facilitator superfamily domain-containing protein [Strongyloides ratti]